FYCTKLECQKHRSRRTKHSRYGRHDHLNPDYATFGSRKAPIPAASSSLPMLQAGADCGGCAAGQAAHQ
ncbi:MAG TPA: hypothetical protein VNZ52_10670, partial [Candidatus Thermoplasmatota archaeon]|nr:hypothetical protein [Candidatus Thermoplasmatota archaeon]